MDSVAFHEQIMNARRTEPPQETVRYLWMPRTDSGVSVTHDNALKMSAVWACVRVIAETVSQLRWSVFQQRTDRGRDELRTHPAFRLIEFSPNSEMTPFTWRETMLGHVLTYGNAFSEIERDNASRPIGLWPLAPDRVEVLRDANLDLFYRYHQPFGEAVDLSPRDVFHLRGLGFDGCSGYSVIQMAAQAIGLGKVQEQAGASFWKNGARPGGILTPAGNLTSESRDSITRQWQEQYGGGQNFNRVALLSHDLKYQPIGIPAEDAQFIDSRKFSVEEIARWYRVPPHKIASLDRATFANIEHQSIEFVVDTIVPWAVRFEQEIDAKLIRSPAKRVFSKVLVKSLLRGDSAARATFYREMRDLGVMSINDIALEEDMNPVEGGDLRLVPMNMMTIEQAAKPPEPAPAAPVTESDDDEPDGSESDSGRFAATFRPLVHAAMGRIITRELNAIRTPYLRSDVTKAVEFYGGHGDYMRNQLQPIHHVVMSASGLGTEADQFLDSIANTHIAESRSMIEQAATCQTSFEQLQETWQVSRVDQQTDWIVNTLWESINVR